MNPSEYPAEPAVKREGTPSQLKNEMETIMHSEEFLDQNRQRD